MTENDGNTKSLRVLIADDDPEIADSIKFALRGKGFEVLLAQDGNEGLAMAEKEDLDLIILDMMMPLRSGFLVVEELRRTDVTTPIIMITANEGNRHREYAEMLGVNEYVQKPFAMDRLLEVVNKLVKK